MEENGKANPEESPEERGEQNLGKFKSVDALLRAYGELEAEFTRRSQRLKALEERERETAPPAGAEREGEELYRAVSQNEGVRARIVGDYLNSLKGVPLMTDAGTGVTAPAARPKSVAEAGSLALGYLRKRKN